MVLASAFVLFVLRLLVGQLVQRCYFWQRVGCILGVVDERVAKQLPQRCELSFAFWAAHSFYHFVSLKFAIFRASLFQSRPFPHIPAVSAILVVTIAKLMVRFIETYRSIPNL